MFSSPFLPARFLRAVSGTAPFAEYCRDRGVAFGRGPPSSFHGKDARRWAEAISGLPPEGRARVELELAMADEMSDPEGTAHLLEAARGNELPPADVPGGAPLALFFLVHRPELFREVYFHHQAEAGCWHAGRAATGVDFTDVGGAAGFLAEELQAFFGLIEGGTPFCAAEAHRIADGYCFLAQVAARPHIQSTFTDGGVPAARRVRPARPVLFLYRPDDGTVLVRSHVRSPDRIDGLLAAFGRAALGCLVVPDGEAFDLDALKRPFCPLPDREDMQAVRVKTLHLRRPAQGGRRVLKLETLAGDGPAAVQEMLHAHVRPSDLDDLRVCHAELQVTLLLDGRRKHYPVRLWPDRCNLGQTPLGNRLRACLRRWGLTRGR